MTEETLTLYKNEMSTERPLTPTAKHASDYRKRFNALFFGQRGDECEDQSAEVNTSKKHENIQNENKNFTQTIKYDGSCTVVVVEACLMVKLVVQREEKKKMENGKRIFVCIQQDFIRLMAKKWIHG